MSHSHYRHSWHTWCRYIMKTLFRIYGFVFFVVDELLNKQPSYWLFGTAWGSCGVTEMKTTLDALNNLGDVIFFFCSGSIGIYCICRQRKLLSNVKGLNFRLKGRWPVRLSTCMCSDRLVSFPMEVYHCVGVKMFYSVYSGSDKSQNEHTNMTSQSRSIKCPEVPLSYYFIYNTTTYCIEQTCCPQSERLG